jgi:hypothetical protein
MLGIRMTVWEKNCFQGSKQEFILLFFAQVIPIEHIPSVVKPLTDKLKAGAHLIIFVQAVP